MTAAVVTSGVDGARAEVEGLAGATRPFLPGASAAIAPSVCAFAMEPGRAISEGPTRLASAQGEGPYLTPAGDAARFHLRTGPRFVNAGVLRLAAQSADALAACGPAKETGRAVRGLPARLCGNCELGNGLAGAVTKGADTGGNGRIAHQRPRAACPVQRDEWSAAMALGRELGTVALDAIAGVAASAARPGVRLEELVHLAAMGQLEEVGVVVAQHGLEGVAARVVHRLDALLLGLCVHRDDACPKLPPQGPLALCSELVDARLTLGTVHLPTLDTLAALGPDRGGAERCQRPA